MISRRSLLVSLTALVPVVGGCSGRVTEPNSIGTGNVADGYALEDVTSWTAGGAFAASAELVVDGNLQNTSDTERRLPTIEAAIESRSGGSVTREAKYRGTSGWVPRSEVSDPRSSPDEATDFRVIYAPEDETAIENVVLTVSSSAP